MAKLVLFLFIGVCCVALSSGLKIGRSRWDSTGIIVQGSLYGYAKPEQKANGLHTRQYSRAFVFSDDSKLLAFVVAEVAIIDQAVKKEALERLEEYLGPGVFTDANLLITATHTHSAPGGYNTFWMYQSVTPGFINETFEALVNGIVQSVRTAYLYMEEGHVFINKGKLYDASINRSPSAYYNNPKEETDLYGSEDTDKDMLVLKMTNNASLSMAVLSFFAVHGTSLKNYNGLVSSDNKGYAALKFESEINIGSRPGEGQFVAGFSQTAQGDATPCTRGQFCVNSTTERCDYYNTTCAGHPHDPRSCYGLGPTDDQFSDLETIGNLQFQAAMDLFEQAVTELTGPIDYIHQWVNMSDVTVEVQGKQVKTCLPAMGYSFAAGAVDGAGVPPFTQGRVEPIEGIEKLTSYVFHKSPEEAECHKPKPILLPTGQTNCPYPWQPQILPLQILRIGNLYLVGIPAEATTMSGRRLQAAIKKVLTNNGAPEEITVLIVSLSNSYSSYVTTYEEYQMQRYEGASTIFGPNTLAAYTQKFELLASALIQNSTVEKGPTPPDLRGKVQEILPDVKIDEKPLLPGMDFGSVIRDAKAEYFQGDVVDVEFASANPRNYVQTEDGYNGYATIYVIQPDHTGVRRYLLDSDSSIRLHWIGGCQKGVDLGIGSCTKSSERSNTQILWSIPADQAHGTFYIYHEGMYKTKDGELVFFSGATSQFVVKER